MKKYKVLISAGVKSHKGTLIGIFFVLLLMMISLVTVLTLWTNSNRYIHEELDRIGYGDLTVWVSQVNNPTTLIDQIAGIPQMSQVTYDQLIYSNYEINSQESDSEGQVILYSQEANAYRFFKGNLTGYQSQSPTIEDGQVYVSPSLISMFDLELGQEIVFPLARNGKKVSLVVAGYYEDPIMGSSMIGMKGFLVNEKTWHEMADISLNAGIDALSRTGMMIHLSQNHSNVTSSPMFSSKDFNALVNDQSDLGLYSEAAHSHETISGFMLILQNVFSGLLMAFVIILLGVSLVVVTYSLHSTLESDFKDMSILKTLGYTSKTIRRVQVYQYMIPIFLGLLIGWMIASPFVKGVSQVTLTTTGILMPIQYPIGFIFLAMIALVGLFVIFIYGKTRRIELIRPMTMMNDVKGSLKDLAGLKLAKQNYKRKIAIRQILIAKKRYMSVLIVAGLLVFFASIVGRTATWLGPDGQGLMDAFNPSDLHLGVQIFGDISYDEVNQEIEAISPITDEYMLAMPNVSINGVDYTANVITDPNRFHILNGKTSQADDEVVLTSFLAEDLDLEIGDTITLASNKGQGQYKISGIYQCANDMGDNLGMSRQAFDKIGNDTPNIWCHHLFLEDDSQKLAVKEKLDKLYGGDIHVHQNSWPGLAGIIGAMNALHLFMYVMVFVFVLIVSALTVNRIIQFEEKDMAIYKSLGMTSHALRKSISLRFAFIGLIGGLIGSVCAAFLTDPLIGQLMKMEGISRFHSIGNPLNVGLPIVLVTLLFALYAYALSFKVKKVSLIRLIK